MLFQIRRGVNAEIFREINVRAAVAVINFQNGKSVTSCIGASASIGSGPASIAANCSRKSIRHRLTGFQFE